MRPFHRSALISEARRAKYLEDNDLDDLPLRLSDFLAFFGGRRKQTRKKLLDVEFDKWRRSVAARCALPDGSLQPTATAITNLLQAIVHADDAGLPASELGAELVVQLLDFAGRNPFKRITNG
ncbi:MAG: hypothetical protein LH475_04020 [Cryobacterium sp.]|uniref:hypothetical protein n=1 Tax=Cryobacterium sp. TaxID=1926290 RepID=UPI0022A54FA9|nr:hypothetical protein [Cryobacterium sp.]MCY7403787.1 hypothetical protein [Cryobacterium sp.]